MKTYLNHCARRTAGGWLFLLLGLLSLNLQAGGITDVIQTNQDTVMLHTDREQFGNFAGFDSDSTQSLYVTMNAGEALRIGLGVAFNQNGLPQTNNNAFYQFRITRVDPATGLKTVVHGPFVITPTNANLQSYDQALMNSYSTENAAGVAYYRMVSDTRSEVTTDNVFLFEPTLDGEYSIEFEDIDPQAGNTFRTNNAERQYKNIGLWDFTVTQNDTPIEGRLWSRGWAFRTPPLGGTRENEPECIFNREFNAKLYSYTDDRFVSEIDFEDSGFQGLTFNIAFNRFGPGNIANGLEAARQSVTGENSIKGEHRIFLSPPDINEFPSGVCGEVTTDDEFRCTNDEGAPYCLNTSVTIAGQVDIILDFNNNRRVDEIDRILVAEFARDGSSACIPWDGLRGDGTVADFRDTVNVIISYSQGVQHYAAFDVELIKQGYRVRTVRPICDDNQGNARQLFWDDRNIVTEDGQPSEPVIGGNVPRDGRDGCDNPESGCRIWTNFAVADCDDTSNSGTAGYGDKNTINTYWFAGTQREGTLRLPVVSARIDGPETLCQGAEVVLTGIDDASLDVNESYEWTLGLDGEVLATTETLTVTEAGTYCVTISSPVSSCSNTTCQTIAFIAFDAPEFPAALAVCFGESVQLPVAGDEAYTYFWSPALGVDDVTSNQPTFSPTVTTVYTVSITGANSAGQLCEITSQVTVNVTPEIGLTVVGGGPICDDQTSFTVSTLDPSVAVVVTDQSGATINGSNGVYTVDVSGRNRYQIVATNDQGCQDNTTFDVIGGAVNISVVESDPGCSAEDINLSVANLDANDTLTYSWSPANLFVAGTASTATPDYAGGPIDTTVSVLVTNQFGCTQLIEGIDLVVLDVGLEVVSDQQTCEPQSTFTVTTIDPDATLVVTDQNGAVISGTNGTYTVDVSGRTTYSLTATNTAGCVETTTFDISGGPVNVTVPDSVLVCSAEEVNLSVTNLDANDILTYSWMPASLFTAGTASTATPDYNGGPVDTTVSVTITNQFGCEETIENIRLIVLDGDATLAFDANAACDGQTVAFDGTSDATFGFVYDFGDGTTANALDVVHIYDSPGTYTVTLSLIYPGQTCIAPVTEQVVVVEAVLIADFVSGTGDCGNGVVDLTFNDATTNANNADLTYNWTFTGATPTSSTDINPTVRVDQSGSVEAMLVVTSSEGCVDSITRQLDVSLGVVNLREEVTICPGESAELNPGGSATDGQTYNWSPAPDFDANDPNPVTMTAGVYTVTVTPAETVVFCSRVDTIEVVVADSINLVVNGPNGPLTGPGSGGNGGGGNGGGGGTSNGAGNFPSVATCGEPAVLSVDLNTVPDGVTVSYEDINGNPIDSDNGTLTRNLAERTCAGNTDTVVVVAVDQFGCPERDTIVLINNQVRATIDVGPGGLNFCAAQDTSVGVTNLLPECDTLTYAWEPNDIINGPLDGPRVDITSPDDGMVELMVTVTNTFGCDTMLTVTITSTPFMPNQFPDETLTPCFNETITISGGTRVADYDYAWIPSTGLDLSDPANPVGAFTEDQELMVAITDRTTGCTDTQTVVIDVAPEISLMNSPVDTVICAPGNITVGASSVNDNLDITWYNNPELTDQAGTGSSVVIAATEVGQTYTVYGEAVDRTTGCRDTVSSTVRVSTITSNPPMDAVVSCNGDPVSIFGADGPTGGLVYDYSPDGVIDVSDPNNPVFVGTENTTVTVSVLDPATGCQNTFTIEATATDLTMLTGVAEPDEIFLGQSTTLTVLGCDTCTIEWEVPNGTIDPQTGSPVTATPDESGDITYVATVTSGACPQDVPITVRVQDPLCVPDRVYVPNAFTPNGDGENDVMRVRSSFLDQLTEFRWIIYDRWGQEVYSSDDASGSWDGTIEGDDLEPDVYGYWLRVRCPSGEELVQQGNITILR